jgi:F-type H+-transporting ATPase subunit epsilon
MQLEFVTLTGPKLQKDVYEVVLPTEDGNIAIFAQHMPLVTTVAPGVITVRHKKGDADEARDVFATNGGIAEMTGKTLRLLVDEADHADDIVEKEASEALVAAKKLKLEAKNQVELEHAETLIDREAVRLKVAELRRHRKNR